MFPSIGLTLILLLQFSNFAIAYQRRGLNIPGSISDAAASSSPPLVDTANIKLPPPQSASDTSTGSSKILADTADDHAAPSTSKAPMAMKESDKDWLVTAMHNFVGKDVARESELVLDESMAHLRSQQNWAAAFLKARRARVARFIRTPQHVGNARERANFVKARADLWSQFLEARKALFDQNYEALRARLEEITAKRMDDHEWVVSMMQNGREGRPGGKAN